MHRKDYEVVAGVLRARRGDSVVARDVVDGIAHDLCGVLFEDNGLFDRERFLSACGVRS